MLLRSLLSTCLLALTLGSTLHAGPVFYALAWRTNPGTFGTIDPSTGVVTPIGGASITVGRDLAISPITGTIYAINDTDLITIDRLTGTPTIVGSLPPDL